MNPMIKFVLTLCVSLLAAPAIAQDQATTMLRASRAAAIVVRATVTAVADPSPAWHRLQFRADELLKGRLPATFTMTEPAGQCCGRALFALQVGEVRLLYLRRVGRTLHAFGGGRGVLPATAPLLAHARALLAADDDAAATRLLAAELHNDEPRIATDAALALAAMPALSLTTTERQSVMRALTLAVQRGTTRAAPLADIAARVSDAPTIDALLPLYLGARRDDQARLLGRALERCPPAVVASRMPIFTGADRRQNLRAVELLTKLPPESAQATMTGMLQRPQHPRIQMELCEGLLCAGVAEASLEPLVPAPVLELAVERTARRRSFRNVTPLR